MCEVHQFSRVDKYRRTLAEMTGILPCDQDVPCHPPWHGELASRPLGGRLCPQQWDASHWLLILQARQPLTVGNRGTRGTWLPAWLWEPHMVLGACLVSVGEWGPVLPSPMIHQLQLPHSLLSPPSHCPEFLWSLLKEAGRNRKVEGSVGTELIRMGDSSCQSTGFSKKLFLFPNGK